MTLKDDEMFCCSVVVVALLDRNDYKTSKFRLNPNSRGLVPMTCRDSNGRGIIWRSVLRLVATQLVEVA